MFERNITKHITNLGGDLEWGNVGLMVWSSFNLVDMFRTYINHSLATHIYVSLPLMYCSSLVVLKYVILFDYFSNPILYRLLGTRGLDV